MSTDSPIKYNPDRKLNEDQKKINPDPRYWDWFDAWWDQDFSWEGLAKRKIEGWDDGRTLQYYWREEEDKLIPFGKDINGKLRQWTIFHQPPHDLEGKTSWKHGFKIATWDDARWQHWKTAVLGRLADTALNPQHSEQDDRAQFSGVCFPNYFFIPTPTYKSEYKGREIEFSLYIKADWALFGNYISFANCIFFSNSTFNYALFRKKSMFIDARFSSSIRFEHTVFGRDAQFTSAKFHRNTSFVYATFGKGAQFDYATFGPFAYFDNAKFHGTCIFGMKVDPGEIPEAYDLSFKGTQFYGDVHFTNRVFQPKTDFTKAEFHKLADFHGCEFHQDTSFADAIFQPPADNEQAEKYENAFRTLRLLMETLRNHEQELKFSKLEMQARERRVGSKDVPWWVRWLSRGYGIISDYGQNVLWPFLWLSAAWLFASIAYSCIAQIDYPIALSFGDAASVAFQYSLPPVSTFAAQFFAGEVDQGFINALLDHPFLTRLVMVLHGVTSLALVFFLLLALKRRFQIR